MTISEFEGGKIIACPPPLEETPEERLLRAIFGQVCAECGADAVTECAADCPSRFDEDR